ncbi:MAG: helix-turn-helix domain-containing protein [Mycobacterium sp.]|nr:helix-turn-helix domain-containing protein [Mycobacterium sp.]
MAKDLPSDWWTTQDVATYLGVTPSTVRSYATRAQIPPADRRIGREPVWKPATIRKWNERRPHRRSAT